jgi:ABC-2 type transport system permease protein
MILGLEPRRIWGMMLRSLYVDRHNPSQVFELAIVPVLELLVWGLLTIWIQREGLELPRAIELFLGARVLWVFMYRTQTAVVLTFLEDMWTRNLINVFVTPVRVGEILLSSGCLGAMKALITAIVLTLACWAIYQTNLIALGITGAGAIVTLLVMGWAFGIFTAAVILRHGTVVQSITWAIPIALQPISAVYYPIEVLPAWLQPLAMCSPRHTSSKACATSS